MSIHFMFCSCFSFRYVKYAHSCKAVAACKHTSIHTDKQQTSTHEIHSTEQTGLGLQCNEMVQYGGFLLYIIYHHECIVAVLLNKIKKSENPFNIDVLSIFIDSWFIFKFFLVLKSVFNIISHISQLHLSTGLHSSDAFHTSVPMFPYTFIQQFCSRKE